MKEIINVIPYFISVFISTIFYNLCYIKLNNHKLLLNVKTILIIFFASLLVFFCNCYDNLCLKFVFVPLISCISFKILYKDDMKKTIITYIFLFLIIILIELLLTNVLNNFGILHTYSSIVLPSLLKIVLSTFVVIIEYILISIKKVTKYFQKLIVIFNDINTISIVYLLYMSCFPLGMFNIENFNSEGSTKWILILTLVFLILFIIIVRLKTKEEVLKITNKKIISYNDKYGQFLDEYKIYKHNINHKLAAMKTFGNKKINALIDDLLEEETTFSIKNNNLYNIPNGIKGIVAEKLYNKDYNIIISNKVKKDPFINLNPKTFNSISECIGIALDNATEASNETKNPIILMDLYEDNENVFIKIGNNFCNTIELDKLGNKYYSTKNRGSGLGLFSIMRNKMVKEKISIINEFYYIELQIKKAR